jgi:nicotinamidase/pyrazinamidase
MGIVANRDCSALLLVDIQPDFMPGGALPVTDGDSIIPPVRAVMESNMFGLMVATQDWHPPGHVSFAGSHPGSRPIDQVDLYGRPQVLWPDHCVQGSAGAALHPGLPWERVQAIVRKGVDPQCESYSGFRNNWNARGQRPPTGLAGYLRERGIVDVFVCGLARDYCCKWTAEDAAAAGFRVFFIWDCTRPVDPGSDGRVRMDLASLGIMIVPSIDLAD